MTMKFNNANPHVPYLKSCSKTDLDLGNIVYLLGYSEKHELSVGEGKVVVATDNLIKLSTEGVIWSPGSAGFDANGNLAFMVCDPMKLSSSPNTKSCSTSSSSASSWKRDFSMQFGIPIPIILDWLNQHWVGNLDELCKPKLPLQLISTGSRNELSCGSFTMRRVFKSMEGENESSNAICRAMENPGSISNALEEEEVTGDKRTDAHISGIPTPEIYESPKLILTPIENKAATSIQIQLLDINFPPRIFPKPGDASSAKPSRKVPEPMPAENHSDNVSVRLHEEENSHENEPSVHAESTGSVNGAQNDIHSSSELPHEYSSDGETTMYSAETAESRNIPISGPRKLQTVGRSQSCVNYPRWGPVQRCSVARGAMLEKHRSFAKSRKVHSQGAASPRSNDYFGPTVSSIMKKRNNMELQIRPKQNVVHTSPRWMF